MRTTQPAALVVGHALEQHAAAVLDAADAAPAGEHGDGLAGAVAHHDLERRASRPGDDADALDLAADADRLTQLGASPIGVRPRPA